MFEVLDAVKIRMMAEFVKQILPVCAVFAGVTLAVAFIQHERSDCDARDRVVNLLVTSSVSMICAICASAFFLVGYGVIEGGWTSVVQGRGWPERMNTMGANLLLEEKGLSLAGLWLVAYLGAGLGIFYALKAIGMSGYIRNESEGRRTLRLMVVGLVVIALCFVLLVAV